MGISEIFRLHTHPTDTCTTKPDDRAILEECDPDCPLLESCPPGTLGFYGYPTESLDGTRITELTAIGACENPPYNNAIHKQGEGGVCYLTCTRDEIPREVKNK